MERGGGGLFIRITRWSARLNATWAIYSAFLKRKKTWNESRTITYGVAAGALPAALHLQTADPGDPVKMFIKKEIRSERIIVMETEGLLETVNCMVCCVETRTVDTGRCLREAEMKINWYNGEQSKCGLTVSLQPLVDEKCIKLPIISFRGSSAFRTFSFSRIWFFLFI